MSDIIAEIFINTLSIPVSNHQFFFFLCHHHVYIAFKIPIETTDQSSLGSLHLFIVLSVQSFNAYFDLYHSHATLCNIIKYYYSFVKFKVKRISNNLLNDDLLMASACSFFFFRNFKYFRDRLKSLNLDLLSIKI